MPLPFFYHEMIDAGEPVVELGEDTSRHITQVLRMEKGASLQLTNGKGYLFLCELLQPHKKHTLVNVVSASLARPPKRKITIAISPLKNSNRFEWFLEKATELGVTEVIPLLCDRTEKINLRPDRLRGVMISALLQSQQSWLPVLQQATRFSEVCSNYESLLSPAKFIAHCATGDTKVSLGVSPVDKSCIILIGPEGDFSPPEINMAVRLNFIPVSLGDTRLRTETAGVAAAVILKMMATNQ